MLTPQQWGRPDGSIEDDSIWDWIFSRQRSNVCSCIRSVLGERDVSIHEFEWRMLGECRGLDPDIFYPDDDDEADLAKEICERCGVRDSCLEHALARREKAGVWGGRTERERRRIIRQRRRSA